MLRPDEVVFAPDDFKKELEALDHALRRGLSAFNIPISLALVAHIKNEYGQHWKISDKMYAQYIRLFFVPLKQQIVAPKIHITKVE